MGRYVWRKSEIVQPEIGLANPTGTVQAYQDYSLEGNFGFKFTANDSRVDFTDWTFSKICNFLNGFVVSTGTDGYYLTFNGSSLLWTNSSRSYYIATNGGIVSQSGNVVIFEPSTWSAGAFTRAMQYTGTKNIQELITSPYCFVCSNKADQYPSNGEYNGYWYELIGTIESTNALSLSTLSADTMRDIAIEEVQQEVINVD